MSAHTPGPWVAKQPAKILGCNTYGQAYVHAKDVTIACTLGGDQTANACLIAAAPELLEALEEVYRVLSEHPAYMGDEATHEQIDAEGGDAAMMTWLGHMAIAAISCAKGQK